MHSGRLDGTLLAVLALIPLAAFEIVLPLPAATQSWQRARRPPPGLRGHRRAAPCPSHGPGSAARRAAPVVGVAVWARYPGPDRAGWGRRPDLAPGCRLAVVGPSGAGKTTLAHVFVRFLPSRREPALDDVPRTARRLRRPAPWWAS